MPRSKFAPSTLNAAERRARVMQLREEGLTIRAIAEKEGVSQRRIRQLLEEGTTRLLDRHDQLARDLLERSLSHLDDLLEAVWDDAMEGDVRSVAQALAIIDRRTRLLGLDAPSRQEATFQFAGVVGTAELESRAKALGLDLNSLRGPEPPGLALKNEQIPMDV